jgi:hypothetical protein
VHLARCICIASLVAPMLLENLMTSRTGITPCVGVADDGAWKA